MIFYIIRTPEKTRAWAKPEIKDFETFELALNCYNHVLEYNREYSPLEWIALIGRSYKMCPKTLKVIEAIKQAMT